MSAEEVFPPGMKKGLQQLLESDGKTLLILSDDSGGLLRVDLATGDTLKQVGTFSGLEPQVIPTMIANARAKYLGQAPAPTRKRQHVAGSAYTYGRNKSRPGWTPESGS